MSEKILFVFEGEKTEHVLTRDFIEQYFESNGKTVVKVSFCGEIYQLYKKLKNDPLGMDFVDIFPLLKARDESLAQYGRDEFSQIYMFFDYDPHASQADIEKVREMLSVFSEETDKGNLFISYPMVESLRCFNGNTDDFLTFSIPFEKVRDFKSFVQEYADKKYNDVPKWGRDMWNEIIHLHCKKANFITNEINVFPDSYIGQSSILECQHLKESTENEVFVLNSFPMMFLSHFGNRSEDVLKLSVNSKS
ncbi:hypothetical protein [Pectobacterium atrosepticum]|uniref:hypothetical protein n=1 Tax=Pectobacterium atrosepticum TaxID=29471 RepID=UPI000CDD6412|nr:hypothetical protein [Pectobacterium atrosepticum]POW23580.1 hypothetical protein PB72LOC_04494 [Pectobacterium atrosepticum]